MYESEHRCILYNERWFIVVNIDSVILFVNQQEQDLLLRPLDNDLYCSICNAHTERFDDLGFGRQPNISTNN